MLRSGLRAWFETAPPLSQRRIFLFWLPLAASWLLMSGEMPFVNAALARLNDAERMIAAFGIVGSLSITIESPVIMLLATSTALAGTRQSYAMLRRYTQHLMLLTTLVHILIGWTSLFDVVVRGWMHVPEDLIEPVRLGMRLMIFWSAAIAWRRFLQGLLIRYGATRFVGQGTLVRLLASAGVATVLALSGRLPGIAVGAIALSVGVIVEALYAQRAAGHIIERQFGPSAPQSEAPPLTYAGLVRFHAPLGTSTLLYLLTQPMISAAISRLPNPQPSLAAWAVAAGLLFVVRSPVMALPEVIIARIGAGAARSALRLFSLRVGLACLFVLALVAFTPLGRLYFGSLIGIDPALTSLAVASVQAALLLPFMTALQNWFRGELTAARATPAITLAMIANLSTMLLVLAWGVSYRVPGVRLAGLALTLSVFAETVTLWAASRRVRALRQGLALA
jgi:progressive ankylosis protein